MHDDQQTPAVVHPDEGIPGLSLTAGIHDSQEGIKEGFGGLLKRDPLMPYRIRAGFLSIPDKGDPVETITNIHGSNILMRIYVVNTKEGKNPLPLA